MNFNPDNIKIFTSETRFSDNIDKQKIYLEKIERMRKNITPKEEDFIGFYPEAEVLRDIKYVEKREATFIEINNEKGDLINSIERNKRISDIYEGVIVEQAEQNNWFGKNVNFYPASKYDDYANGVDGVAEFFDTKTEDREYVAMSFDVIFSNHAEHVVDKLKITKKMIDEGHLSEVKYFEDADGNKKRLSAPRIILGSRLISAEKLIDLWGSKKTDRNKQLAEHPIQIKLLLETYLQAHHFCNYAVSIDNIHIARAYAIIANKISDILNNEKSDFLQKYYNDLSEDIVFEAIKDYCHTVKI